MVEMGERTHWQRTIPEVWGSCQSLYFRGAHQELLPSISPWQRSGSLCPMNRRFFQTVCRDHYAITDKFAIEALGARLCEALYVDPDATSRYDETQPSRMYTPSRRQQKHQKHGLPHCCTLITINSDATRGSVVFASRSRARSPTSKENIGSSWRSLYFPNLPQIRGFPRAQGSDFPQP
jgi:hypothetical protein